LFLLKKGRNKNWQQIYNCEFCEANESLSKRECFYKNDLLEFQLFDFDDRGQPIPESNRMVELSIEEFFEEVALVHSRFSNISVFDIVNGHWRGLCPQSLIDYETVELINLEDACSKYHQLPYAGALLDQPKCILDAFEVIRAAIINFENELLDKISKSGGKQ